MSGLDAGQLDELEKLGQRTAGGSAGQGKRPPTGTYLARGAHRCQRIRPQ